MRLTSITIGGEPWTVPFGFGREYMRAAKGEAQLLAKGKPGCVIEIIRNQLELIGYTASVETISNWPRRKRLEASVYAMNVHLRASDNPLPTHPKPDWLPEPWKGGADSGALFLVPNPTSLD